MKFKFIAAALVIATSASLSIAFAAGSPLKKKAFPSPSNPYPSAPQQPTIPNLPPDNPDPTIPTIPDIPPPGPDQGPEVPFPLSASLPFPWSSIQGTWRVELSGAHYLFSFDVEVDYHGTQYLHVVQIDRNNGDILAEGIGISVANDKLVRAAMSPKRSGDSAYMLFVGSYRNTPGYAVRGQVSNTLTVLTVRSFADLMGDNDAQVIVTKVSNVPHPVQKSLPKPVIAY